PHRGRQSAQHVARRHRVPERPEASGHMAAALILVPVARFGLPALHGRREEIPRPAVAFPVERPFDVGDQISPALLLFGLETVFLEECSRFRVLPGGLEKGARLLQQLLFETVHRNNSIARWGVILVWCSPRQAYQQRPQLTASVRISSRLE